MKVSELIDILDHYDPDDDVVISAQPTQTYFHFVVTQHSSQSLTEGKGYVVALEPTEQVGVIIVTLED
jgi:hypothetical protein